MKEHRLKTLLRTYKMPLSERMRLDAGRPFIHTLTARILVAVFLVITILFTSAKQHNSGHHYYDLTLSKAEPTSITKVVAQNDIYGR